LLVALDHKFTYTFGGCATLRGLEGNYLSRAGMVIRDRINLVYINTPFTFDAHLALIGRYADDVRAAASETLEEEAILIVVSRVQHAE
jgi:hypothetical protein